MDHMPALPSGFGGLTAQDPHLGTEGDCKHQRKEAGLAGVAVGGLEGSDRSVVQRVGPLEEALGGAREVLVPAWLPSGQLAIGVQRRIEPLSATGEDDSWAKQVPTSSGSATSFATGAHGGDGLAMPEFGGAARKVAHSLSMSEADGDSFDFRCDLSPSDRTGDSTCSVCGVTKNARDVLVCDSCCRSVCIH